MAPRLLYRRERTPETPSLKGTGEEFQGERGETTKTAASTKRQTGRQAGRGRDVVSQPLSYVAEEILESFDYFLTIERPSDIAEGFFSFIASVDFGP